MAVTALSPDVSNFRVPSNGESSPSPLPLSAESSFRELDDAFLQTQTRIWLGEVLQIRFDEETNISDILADGGLLFEVSEVLSRMLPLPAEEAPHLRVNESKTLALSKSTRRYMPYYNVGSFLRMCKNLGLNGIDLFSPSDVVEKRNMRKVCMCIRSVSKKVRSRDINVPDFDSVVCTLAMPTDMVEGIRKSLELSQYSSSLSTGHESEKVSRVRYWKRMSNSDSMVSNGYSSDNCDEAESRPLVVETNQPSDNACVTSPTIPGSQQRMFNSDSMVSNGYSLDSCDEAESRPLVVESNQPSDYACIISPTIPGSQQRMFNLDTMVSNGYSSDNCGEAENRPLVVESNQPSDYACVTSPTFLGSQLIRDDNSLPKLQLDTGEVENEEFVQCEYLSPSVPESVGSPSSVYYSDQELSSLPSSIFLASCIGGMNCKAQDEHQNGDVNHVPIDWGDISSDDDYRDHTAIIDEIGLLSHDKDNSDTTSCDSCPLTRENKTYYAGIENLSCPSDIGCEESSCDTLKEIHQNNSVSVGGRDLDVCDVCPGETSLCPENEKADHDAAKYGMLTCELSPDVGKLSSDGIVQDNHLPPQLTQTTHHVSSHAENLDSPTNDRNYASQVSPEATNPIDKAFDVKMLTSDHTEECNDKDYIGIIASHPMYMPDSESSCMVTTKDDKKCSDQGSQDTREVLEDRNIQVENNNCKLVNVEDQPSVNSSTTTLCCPQPEAERLENVEVTDDKHHQCADNMEKGVSEVNGIDQEMPQSKPQRTLLKSVVKGTALVGVAVFLLHLRKNGKFHIPKPKKKEPMEAPRKSTPKLSSQKAEKGGSSSGVYPAQKLHLGI